MNLLRAFLSASLVAASVAAGQTEDFYEARLAAGSQAFRAQRLPEAIDQFRIAAFGLMDRPALLEEALARLALALEAIGSKEGVAETVKRFVDAERRFGGFAQARLEPAARAAFTGLLARQVPAETLASIPSLGGARPTSNPPQAAAKEVPATNSPVKGVTRPREPEESPAQAAAQEANVPPRYRTTVPPKYPAAALKDQVGGTVLLRVLVSETGDPLKVEVIRQVRSDLAEAAVSAVRLWTFEPALKDGVPVQASLTIPVAFRISRGPATPR